MERRSFVAQVSVFAAAAALSSMLGGCPAPAVEVPRTATTAPSVGTEQADPVPVFRQALKDLKSNDASGRWSESMCRATAERFLEADRLVRTLQDHNFFEAIYNAGISYQRCRNSAAARRLFEAILKEEPRFHRARVQVALYDFRESGDLDRAIGELERAMIDAEFKNEEALVNLAILQMRRDSSVEDKYGMDDQHGALANIKRALAINDSSMPALNQLAIYHLEAAKRQAGLTRRVMTDSAAGEARRADTQALELAALVCAQALEKNPRYAPLHNTSGLISAELGDLSAAAAAFGRARSLDPGFFEAHMNYGAVNIRFRGFTEAQRAYERALELSPDDYEAHLGLALSLRGQIVEQHWDSRVAMVERELSAARRLAPERPEAYYNQALFTEEFLSHRGASEARISALTQAQSLFRTFITKAGERDEYAGAVASSRDRIRDISTVVAFMKQDQVSGAPQ